MTTTTAPIPSHATTTAIRAGWGASQDAIAFGVSIGVLAILYLLLQNAYWVPGGDSEVYTAIARNLAVGWGYTFNGQPVSMVPPGWCWFLAGAMKISPTFLFLKLLTMGCMLGSLAISYWICRRFASPTICALVIVLTGVISHVYSLTFWLHSDALFCLVSSASFLVAFQISEGREQAWRGILLVVLCGVAVLVRWAGLLNWLVIAAILLRGEWRPQLNDFWYRAASTGLVTLLTFLTLRAALTVSPDVQRKIREFGGTGEEAATPAVVEKADRNLAETYSLFNPAAGGVMGYVARAVSWGNWYSYLLWQPLRLGRSNTLVNLVSLIAGWAVLAPLLLQTWQEARRREWIWLAVVIYSFALAMNWPNPNARYLVPVAPLIVLAVFKATDALRQQWAEPAIARTFNVVQGYFVAAVLLCNGALYACDAAVARSDDFYANYEAGLNRDLIQAAHWLKEHPPRDGAMIAVCERYENLGRIRVSRLGLRATTMLTGQPIVSVPMRYLRGGDPRGNRHFLNWARSPDVNVKYVLYQPAVSPWRVFHFRTGWLQEAMTDQPAIDTGAGWRLYEIPREGEEAIRIRIPPKPNWPTRVPGL